MSRFQATTHLTDANHTYMIHIAWWCSSSSLHTHTPKQVLRDHQISYFWKRRIVGPWDQIVILLQYNFICKKSFTSFSYLFIHSQSHRHPDCYNECTRDFFSLICISKHMLLVLCIFPRIIIIISDWCTLVYGVFQMPISLFSRICRSFFPLLLYPSINHTFSYYNCFLFQTFIMLLPIVHKFCPPLSIIKNF